MTHTKQFLQGMFAAYMGCEVINTDEGKHLKMIAISGYFISVYEPPYPFCESEGDEYEWMFSECKPILNPLSEITDEDAVEVAKIARCRYQSIESIIVAGRELVTIYLDRSSNVSAIYWVNIIDYLRSKHYDLGYMHIKELITAGLAIKKTI